MTAAEHADAARRLANAVATENHAEYARLSYAICGLPREDRAAVERIFAAMRGAGQSARRPGA